ncbi:MerR family transcriptional regulator [Novipirellula artificiosorum]|uniref:MerR family transcriptional regulator n=1 Tax=Novipirellula artificiosorum TaxID=2528016 RepID=UPI0011B84AD5|nr:helix-turn-helix domain-containing protein [Novipirellula artificiosorum]
MAARLPHFSPKQIANSMQVSESSVKRWCDRGVIPTVRTIGGHRRITLDGLQQFLRETGQTLVHPEAIGLPSLCQCRRTEIPGAKDPEQRSFRSALAEGDEQTCRAVLRARVAGGASRSEAAEDLIADAMHGLGEAWDCKEIDIYQERRACDICQRLMMEMRNEIGPVSADAPVAVGGSPEDDHYQLPTAMVELALREIGWNAINLGSNLPLDSFRQAAHDQNAKLVWLSVSALEDPARFIVAENRLAGSLGEQVSLFVGGRVIDESLRSKLRYTACCGSVRELVQLAGMTQAGIRR